MPIPEFIRDLRRHVGQAELWLPGVTAVVRREGEANRTEVLLVQRADNGQWTPVTGIVEPGEQPAVTAVREVLEEARVHAVVERLAWVQAEPAMTHVNGDRARYLDHTFACRYVSGEAAIGDDESSAVSWFAVDRLPPMRPVYQARIAWVLADEPAARFET